MIWYGLTPYLSFALAPKLCEVFPGYYYYWTTHHQEVQGEKGGHNIAQEYTITIVLLLKLESDHETDIPWQCLKQLI